MKAVPLEMYLWAASKAAETRAVLSQSLMKCVLPDPSETAPS